MQLLFIIMILFVLMISVSLVYRQRKRRKRDQAEDGQRLGYTRRLNYDTTMERDSLRSKQTDNFSYNTSPRDYVTKHNSKIDYIVRSSPSDNEEEEGKSGDWSEWGE
ncbi:MAG: hypothetical protein LBC96_09535 [Lachnospiraceae bacterium]|jgi:flagellar biosynthesis/type III secretory pathway M-ring protein FliF/YscJ|nr:hypothetical protein [Lachnospiraceae bacterium]